VVFIITLLAGFVPLLQVTFIALLEDYLSGLTRYERSGQNSKDHPRDPYHSCTAIRGGGLTPFLIVIKEELAPRS
jgi:hypothetical protein